MKYNREGLGYNREGLGFVCLSPECGASYQQKGIKCPNCGEYPISFLPHDTQLTAEQLLVIRRKIPKARHHAIS